VGSAKAALALTSSPTCFNRSFALPPLHSFPTRRSSDPTAGIGTTTFSALAPGTYTVSETVDPGFVFDLASCAPGSPPGTSPSVRSAEQTCALASRYHVVCPLGLVTQTKNTTGRNRSLGF